MKKSNKKGFTLAELLIVVAIIAVLVAIAIPIFSSQLEKAREATDAANIRAIYAQLSADVLLGNTTTTGPNVAVTYNVADSAGVITGTATYTMTQAKDGTVNGTDVVIGGVTVTSANFKKGTCTITIKDDGSDPTISIA